LYDSGWFLQVLTWSTPLGFIAVVAGWTTTEVGRQPWTVYGVMRTAQSVTPSLTGFDVLLSLLGYMAVYLIMFPTGLWLVMRIIRGGVFPEEATPVEAGRPAAPVRPVPERAP
jgi:cytochrome d ubiquinol oxidase subunit I